MANRIDHLLFWTGGVVLPRLGHLAAGQAPACAGDLLCARRLADLERQLAEGDIAAAEFCEQAAAAAGLPGGADGLLPTMLAAATLPLGLEDLLAELAQSVRLGLVSDYPQPWLETILARSGLSRLFGAANICYTAAWPGSDLFKALAAAGVIRPGHTLLVDHDSRRATAAIRRGIDAALYVDARRLRRDLGLWRLVPLELS